MKYSYVTVGGSFDYFHKGHQALLCRAFAVGEEVWLGITTDTFAVQKISNFKFQISNYEVRHTEVVDFLKANGWFERVKIIPLNDKFGTTLTDKRLEAIIVSPETESVAREINTLRAEKAFTSLDIITVPWVLANDGLQINSVRIRNGEIDRVGKLYTLPQNWGVRKIPDGLREKLHQPLGQLINDMSKNHEEAVKEFISKFMVHSSQFLEKNIFNGSAMNYRLRTMNSALLISVGDAVTDALLRENVIPDVSIVDLHIQRKKVYQNIEDIGFRDIKVHKNTDNPAGTLSFAGFKVLYQLIKYEPKPAVLQVNGEEDLLGLLALFIAPLGSLIVYGQPHEGIVVVEVTEEKKNMSREILDQFSL